MVECTVFGGLVLDRYLEIETFPDRGQDQLIQNEFAMAGGCAINMASTFNNLGGRAHVVSYLGNDDVGRDILSYMKRHDFSLAHVDTVDEESGYCIILLEQDGERTFLTKKGAEGLFRREILKGNEQVIRHALVTGYYLMSDEAHDIVACLEDIADNGGMTLFDPGPLGAEIDADILRRTMAVSDVVCVNESEEPLISGLIRQNHILVVKRGAEGGYIYHRGHTVSYAATDTEVVDTTGAGDSFDAAFFYGLVTGLDIEEAAELGARCAGIVIGIKGPHGFWRAP